MLNKVIIDKFKIMISEADMKLYLENGYISIENLLAENNLNNEFINPKDKPIRQLEKTYNKILSIYFPEYDYFCYRRYGRLYINFNPTRAYREKDTINLQMIPNDVFLNLLKKLGIVDLDILVGSNLIKGFQITEMHLTKTFMVNNHVSNSYVPMLLTEIPYKDCFSPVLHQSIESDSCYFHRLAKNDEKHYTFSKIIKFYDKKFQLYKRGYGKIKLREQLSNEEAELLQDHYNKVTNTLTLNENLNLLRIELAYTSKSVGYIYERLVDTGKKNRKLSLRIVTDCLKRGNLYDKLDAVFTEQLNSSIFCNELASTTDTKAFSKNTPYYKRILPFMDLDKDDLLYLKMLLKDLGYTNSEINKVVEPFIHKNKKNVCYYNELCDLVNAPVSYNPDYNPSLYEPSIPKGSIAVIPEEDTCTDADEEDNNYPRQGMSEDIDQLEDDFTWDDADDIEFDDFDDFE
ncbi:MAG: hypothetical protein WCG23_11800 [bacterium]